jgi:hypothetical protein
MDGIEGFNSDEPRNGTSKDRAQAERVPVLFESTCSEEVDYGITLWHGGNSVQ